MKSDNKGRASLVTVITTPLGFFALSLLIVEGFLGIVLIGSGMKPEQKFMGMCMGAALFIIVVAIVAFLVWKNPQNLTFSESSHLEHDKIYGDQATPLSENKLQDEPKTATSNDKEEVK